MVCCNIFVHRPTNHIMYEVITSALRKLVDFTDEELFLFMQRLRPLHLKKYELYLKEGQVCKMMVLVHKGGLRYYSRTVKESIRSGLLLKVNGWVIMKASCCRHHQTV